MTTRRLHFIHFISHSNNEEKTWVGQEKNEKNDTYFIFVTNFPIKKEDSNG
jgi:hypothetical protein